MDIVEHLGLIVLSGVGTVIWWLLRTKDAQQDLRFVAMQRSIETLFAKHDTNSKAIDEFKLEIAKQHYARPEIDTRFDRIDHAFRSIDAKIDKLVDVILKDHGNK